MSNFKIAIDGPAGSGKSTISKLVASKLGFIHIDTGAMYRALTIEALNRKINLDDENAYRFIDDVDIRYQGDRIFLNEQDVSHDIRMPKITESVSAVSKIPYVREKMKQLQRSVAFKDNIIMDGRDIGYNVLPEANLKIFLTASVEERAKRRKLENESRGINSSLEEIQKDIIKRDYTDSNREASPLKKANDAIVIDTTFLSIDEVIKIIIELVNERMN